MPASQWMHRPSKSLKILNKRKVFVRRDLIFGNLASDLDLETEVVVLAPSSPLDGLGLNRRLCTWHNEPHTALTRFWLSDRWLKGELPAMRLIVDFNPYPTYAALSFLSIGLV